MNMKNPLIQLVAQATGIAERQVDQTIQLLEESATIPFISRYRKERTGGLDEVAIAAIQTAWEKFQALEKRKETIRRTLVETLGQLPDELERRLAATWDAAQIEDLYLPFRPKRRTRAEIAREKGLEPLAKILMAQRETRVGERARAFVKGEIKDEREALRGAQDIIAEWVSEDPDARDMTRQVFSRTVRLVSKVVKGKEAEGANYKNYFDHEEPLARVSSHRLLAIRRGEAEGFLKVSLEPDGERCVERLAKRFVRGEGEASGLVGEAVADAFKRLLKPSIETEFARVSKEKADEEAIRVFAKNLRDLLLAPPLGPKRVLGVDPGFRTGCKLVCLDADGHLLHNETIYPHPPRGERAKAAAKVSLLVKTYKIEAIAIGNGTASRETERFVASIPFSHPPRVFVVNEAGASVYSASKTAREEFPAYDVTVRGAVSIGRRLIDPLAELVKIDPKSIGVGQYQHDVDQNALKRSLDLTVESCVNQVGVNVNTASWHLLAYVSGLGPTLARNIVEYRAEHGLFKNRQALTRVPRMGAKTFEQCAGFLRVADGDNPLDNSAVHPENYPIVERMARDLGCGIEDLIRDKSLKRRLDLSRYESDTVGMPTLRDILAELDKPGRDPRQAIEVFAFDPTIRTLDDVREGQVLPGIVTNVTNFGCFVDIGIKQNGLVHVSEMADRYVSDPMAVVDIHQHVRVRVLAVDRERGQIRLSFKGIE